MFSFDLQSLSLLAAIGAAGYFGVKWFLSKDTEVEARRASAYELAKKLESYGLRHIPTIPAAYALGDYSGLVQKVVEVARIFLAGDEAIVKELDQTFDRVLSVKLATPEGIALLKAKLAEAEKAVA